MELFFSAPLLIVSCGFDILKAKRTSCIKAMDYISVNGLIISPAKGVDHCIVSLTCMTPSIECLLYDFLNALQIRF